jgi:hypothetical protein
MERPEIESLFLREGGRYARLLDRLRLAHEGRLRAGRVAALLAGVTWLPLLLLAAFEGVAWGRRLEVPFLEDFLPYGQFLVAVPVLCVGDAIVGRRLGRAIAELQRSDILAPSDTPALEELSTHAAARWRGRGPNLLVLLLTLTAAVPSYWGAREWLTGSWQFVDNRLTVAGWWYLVVSASVLRFLTLRWVWRLLLWAWILRRLSRLQLRPQPTHPDRAGGLAFLGTTQASFGVLAFALSVQVSCLVADSVYHHGADLTTFQGHVTAFVLIMVGLLLLPLLTFAPRLVRARAEGLVFLSGRGYDGARYLESRLRAGTTGQLPADDVSGLADYCALYENARRMKPLPLDVRNVVVMAAAASLPFVPLVFLVMPAQQVLRTLRDLVI